MKYGLYLLLTIGLIVGAYQVAQNKIGKSQNLDALRLGMTAREVDKAFGTPSAVSRNQITYILEDGSELVITLRDKVVSNAKVKFRHSNQIQDPEMKNLSLIQMDMRDDGTNQPGWFFAGKPESGLIYKITTQGIIESVTWVPPFSYGNNRPKHLQALLQDFKSQRSL